MFFPYPQNNPAVAFPEQYTILESLGVIISRLDEIDQKIKEINLKIRALERMIEFNG